MRVFIGSSSESIDIATEIASWLEKQGWTPLLWDSPDLFIAGKNTLLRLIEVAGDVDAAILVFGEDDKVEVRGQTRFQARDNVLIEFGLFAGKLGPERAIGCVVGDALLPTDLSGLTVLKLGTRKNLAYQRLKAWCKSIKSLEGARVIDPGEGPRLLDQAFSALDAIYLDLHSTPEYHLEVLEYRVRLKINSLGDCSYCEERVQVAKGRYLYLDYFLVEGDSPIEGFYAIQPKVEVVDDAWDATVIPLFNNPRKKKFLARFHPPVPQEETHQIRASWEWPGMFSRLVHGQHDEYMLRFAKRWRIQLLKVEVDLDQGLPELQIRASSNTRGTIVGRSVEGPGRVTIWQIEDIGPEFAAKFSFLPTSRNSV